MLRSSQILFLRSSTMVQWHLGATLLEKCSLNIKSLLPCCFRLRLLVSLFPCFSPCCHLCEQLPELRGPHKEKKRAGTKVLRMSKQHSSRTIHPSDSNFENSVSQLSFACYAEPRQNCTKSSILLWATSSIAVNVFFDKVAAPSLRFRSVFQLAVIQCSSRNFLPKPFLLIANAFPWYFLVNTSKVFIMVNTSKVLKIINCCNVNMLLSENLFHNDHSVSRCYFASLYCPNAL